MARTTRIIEGTWNCSSCEAKAILARHRRCPTCGNPREETGGESQFDFGPTDAATGRSLREAVPHPDLLKAAAAGADWTCGHCGATNRGDAPRCDNCRAERASGWQTQAREERKPWVCKVCGTRNEGLGAACARCFEMVNGTTRPLSAFWRRLPVENPLALRTRVQGMIPVLVLLGLVGWVVAPPIWYSMEREVTGEVVAMAWQRILVRDTFQKVMRRGWRDELKPQPARMPVDGEGEIPGVEAIRDCERSQRGSRQVQDGYDKECETQNVSEDCGTRTRCSRQNLGNGYARETCEEVPKTCSGTLTVCREVPRYRLEPIYAEQCGYDTWEWKQVEQLEEKGQDGTLRWPEGTLVAGPLDRVRRLEGYTARIRYRLGGEPVEYAYMLPSEARYHAMRKGQPVSLRVRNNGEVLGVQLTDAAPPEASGAGGRPVTHATALAGASTQATRRPGPVGIRGDTRRTGPARPMRPGAGEGHVPGPPTG